MGFGVWHPSGLQASYCNILISARLSASLTPWGSRIASLWHLQQRCLVSSSSARGRTYCGFLWSFFIFGEFLQREKVGLQSFCNKTCVNNGFLLFISMVKVLNVFHIPPTCKAELIKAFSLTWNILQNVKTWLQVFPYHSSSFSSSPSPLQF